MQQIASQDMFPSMETKRLFLRQISFDDVGFIFRQFSNAEVSKYLMDEPPIVNTEEAMSIIKSFQKPEINARFRWVIILKSTNEPIGTCGYHNWQKQYYRSELGYDLYPDYWGQGYMKEALRVVISNGMNRMGLHRIDALIYIDNVRSIRLVESLGFTNEGKLRDYFYMNGKYYDHFIFGLLRKEWKG